MIGIAVQGLFEAHLTVANLDASVAFYREAVGLELATRIDARRVAFFWVGPPGRSMLGLWETSDAPMAMRLHVAFTASVADVAAGPERLRAAGIVPRGLRGEPVEEAVVLGWMPAAAIYFSDPDGHLLEYLAMLPDPPRPEAGVVPFSRWKA